MKDFTFDTFKDILHSFRANDYEIMPFIDSLKSSEVTTRHVILRHDVDRFPLQTQQMALMEAANNIKSTYFFRIIPSVFKPEIIREVAKLGHEIGYHYEDLSLCGGDPKKSIDHFARSLDRLRKFYPVETICMHGSPLSKWDNKTIWQKYDYKQYGIIADTSYDGEVLVFRNSLQFLNDTLDGFNATRVSLSFIHPETFETLRMINWSESPINFSKFAYHDMRMNVFGFAKGPTYDGEQEFRYPYFYNIIIPNCLDENQVVNVSLYMTPLNHILDDPSTWVVSNLTIFPFKNFKDDTAGFLNWDPEVWLSMNSSDKVSAFTVYMRIEDNLDTGLGTSDGPSNDQSPSFSGDISRMRFVIGSLIKTFSLSSPLNSSAIYESKLMLSESPSESDFYGLEPNDGINPIIKIVPIRTNVEQPQTTFAFISSSQQLTHMVYGDFNNPDGDSKQNGPRNSVFGDYGVSFMSPTAAGHITGSIPSTPYKMGDAEMVEFQGPTAQITGDIIQPGWFHLTLTADFDADGDGKTDVIIPGTTFSEDRFAEMAEDEYISGPFVIFSH